MKEEQIMKARFKDLASKAYRTNTYTFTAFLTPAEIAELENIKTELDCPFSLFGGNEMCERQMAAFGSEALFGYDVTWPISIVKVEPLMEKFADELGHRDFLGSLMNLGIERNVMGDILVKDNKRAYIMCQNNIAEYIVDNLTKIKHTNVKCRIADNERLTELEPEYKEANYIVASERFDAIIAAVTKCSRSDTLLMFREKKVTLNSKQETRNSISLKPGDVFSVRGYGKYTYEGASGNTRKGKLCINIKIRV